MDTGGIMSSDDDGNAVNNVSTIEGTGDKPGAERSVPVADGGTPVADGSSEFTNVVSLLNGQHFTWIISPSDPIAFPFPDESKFRGWSVLSPVMLPQDLGPIPEVFALRGDRFFVLTQFITVSAPAGIDAHSDAEEVRRWLHLAIGQVELSALLRGTVSSPGVVQGELRSGGLHFKPLNDIEESAITFERMIAAARSHPACDVPPYSEILQDALVACASSDFRKAILYAAIAVEEMAATRLSEAFVLASEREPQRFRIVERRTHDRTVRKDPIFKYLQKNAENNFPLLLDTMALYVINRSMSDECNELYAELLRLRQTRNGLAHGSGSTRDSDKALPLDEDGAHRAIRATIDAFQWFGAPGRYLVNGQSFSHARRIASERLKWQY